MEKDQRLIGVECKMKERPSVNDLKAISRFKTFYGEERVARSYLACPVDMAFDMAPHVTVVPGWKTWTL